MNRRITIKCSDRIYTGHCRKLKSLKNWIRFGIKIAFLTAFRNLCKNQNSFKEPVQLLRHHFKFKLNIQFHENHEYSINIILFKSDSRFKNQIKINFGCLGLYFYCK